jgi:hypothetical protein
MIAGRRAIRIGSGGFKRAPVRLVLVSGLINFRREPAPSGTHLYQQFLPVSVPDFVEKVPNLVAAGAPFFVILQGVA